MSKVQVSAFSVSLDGFGAGPRQDRANPLGVRGLELHEWFQHTAMFRNMQKLDGGSQGVDNDFAIQSFQNVGAWILGRNMFGPIRGPWPDDSWKGWWGDEPPYHVPVFVLTHYARAPLAMKGGTTFYFVTDGPESALQQAKHAADGKNVRIGGDEMHLAFSPVLLGEGENLFAGLNLPKLGFRPVQTTAGEHATHVILKRG
jgi:dihydrofolate reductase